MSFNALSFKIEGLIEDNEYEIRVIAENKAGESLPSEPCKPFIAQDPFTVPGRPENLRIGDVTKSSVELFWSPPKSNGGTPITNYIIEKRDLSTMKWEPIEIGSELKFTLTGLKEGHEYEFRVAAKNKVGQGEFGPISPSVVAKNKGVKPVIVEPLQNIRCKESETVRFRAKFKSETPVKVEWSCNGSIIEKSTEYKLTLDDDQAELVIKEAKEQDRGSYELVVSNAFGQVSTEAYLTLLTKPRIKYSSRIKDTIELVALQQNLRINCDISGFPQPTVTWMINDIDITTTNSNENRALIDSTELNTSIKISKIKKVEEGKYTLVLENEVGKATADFIVKVLDVPSKPVNLTVIDVTSNSCTLSWSEPLDNGGSPITCYFVEKRDAKRDAYMRVEKTTQTQFTVEKLTKDAQYYFRVIAENKIGESEPEELTEPVSIRSKFNVPGAPGIPEILDVTLTSCCVQWTKPSYDGGLPIIGYNLERRTGTRWVRVNKEPIETCFFRLRDLVEGNEYEFRVNAMNEEGEGAFSKNSDVLLIDEKFARPYAPIELEILKITRASCLLQWKPPKSTGVPIVRYHVEMRRKGEEKFNRFTDDFISECEYEVRDLVEGEEYEFRVLAESKLGESTPSQPSKPFKARDPFVGKAPEIADIPDMVSMKGTIGKVEVQVTGNPTPDIVWKKGSRALREDSSKYSISYAQSVAVLFIKDMNDDDTGSYSIEADNSFGCESKSFKYTVYSPPTIDYDKVLFKKNSVVTVGSNMRIVCRIHGIPKPEVQWFKDGQKIKKSEDRLTIDNPSDVVHNLLVKQCTREDSGVYKVLATNANGKAEESFEIKIVDVPEKPRGPLTFEFERGQTTLNAHMAWNHPRWDGNSELVQYVFECAKVSDPHIQRALNWIRVGVTRASSTSFTYEGLLENSHYHFRVYAENAIGLSQPLETDQAILARLPYNVPSQPEGPLQAVDIVQKGCTLKWNPPKDDGGSRLISYVIEAREAKRSTWYKVDTTDASNNELKIHNLIENNSYYFRVMAKNSIGLSIPLESLYPVVIKRPKSEPEPPFPLLVSDIQSENCTLEWKAPIWDGGEDLKGYILEMKVGDDGEWTQIAELEPYTKQYKVRELREKQEYYFRISAFNSIGYSAYLDLKRPVITKKQITVPSAPTGPITVLTVNRDSATISWGPPKHDGGAPLNRYMILYREINTSSWTRAGVVDPDVFTYQINNLQENSFYHFRVLVDNRIGQSDHLQTVEPVQVKSPYGVPDRPQGPLKITNVTSDAITIHWEKPLNDGGSPITGYLIKRRDIQRPVWVKCGRVGADVRTHTIKDLIEGCEYVVQVFAENSEGLSEPLTCDEPVRVHKPVHPPSMPLNLELIKVGANEITLQWEVPISNGGSLIKSYQLEICDIGKRSVAENWTVIDENIDGLNTSFTIRNLIENHNYMIRLSARNSGGLGEPNTYGKIIRTKRPGNAPSSPVGPLTLDSVDNESMTVSWQTPSNDGGSTISHYIVETREAIRAVWNEVGISSSTKFKITNLVTNNDYYVRVIAVNEAGFKSQPLESEHSFTIKIPQNPPSAPRDAQATLNDDYSVTVEFKAPEDSGSSPIRFYTIEKRDISRISWMRCAKFNASTIFKYDITELNSGASYCFRVLAENSDGLSPASNTTQTISIKRQAEVPSRPLDLRLIKQRQSDIILLEWKQPSWNGNDKITGYVVEEWTSDSDEWRQIIQTDYTQLCYRVFNLKDNIKYKYRVRALNSAGASEPSLETEEVQNLSVPSVPTGPLKYEISDDENSIKLEWKKPKSDGGSRITRYIIEKKEIATDTKPMWFKIASSNETSITVQEFFIENSTYSYRVIAENDKGKSQPLELSQPFVFHMKGKKPKAPSQIRIKEKTRDSLTLSWKSDDIYLGDKSELFYIIEKREIGQNDWVKVGQTSSESYTILDLNVQSLYEFRIICSTLSDGVSEALELGEAVTLDISGDLPSAPENLTVEEILHDRVTLTWLRPRNSGKKSIQGYHIYLCESNDEWIQVDEVNKMKFEHTIKGLDYKLSYKFKVTAFSSLGEGEAAETKVIKLKRPIEVPSEPVNFSIRSQRDGEINVSWFEPKNNGGSSITGYQIERAEVFNPQSFSGDFSLFNWLYSETVDGSTTNSRLAHLKVNSFYVVRVCAKNSAGLGPWAYLQPTQAKDLYGPPESPVTPLIITNITRETAEVMWTPGKETGAAPITSYFIEKCDLSMNFWIKVARVDANTRTYTVINLIEGNDYIVRVSAENEYGRSAPAESNRFRPLRIFGKSLF